MTAYAFIKINERERGEMWINVAHITSIREAPGGTRIEMDYTTEGNVRSFLANELPVTITSLIEQAH